MGFTRFNLVLPRFTGFYRVFLVYIGFYWVSLCFSGCCWGVPSFTEFLLDCWCHMWSGTPCGSASECGRTVYRRRWPSNTTAVDSGSLFSSLFSRAGAERKRPAGSVDSEFDYILIDGSLNGRQQWRARARERERERKRKTERVVQLEITSFPSSLFRYPFWVKRRRVSS